MVSVNFKIKMWLLINGSLLDHPELKFEETCAPVHFVIVYVLTSLYHSHAHDALTAFMALRGFSVTQHYYLDTAWEAKFIRGNGGRTIGINSEMDALPGIGHACGHNLIAIAGVAIACAIKSVMEKFDIPGTIILLGTPG